MVILIHVSGVHLREGMALQNYDFSFWSANFINSFCRVCVPIFVLISGAFLVGRIEGFEISYRKRASRILIPLIAWTVIYLLGLFLNSCSVGECIGAKAIVKRVIGGRPYYHLWYLYMLIGLYGILPLLNRAIKGFSRRSLWVLASAMMMFGVINSIYEQFLGGRTLFLLWFVNYLGYFLLGFLLKGTRERITSTKLLGLYVLCCSIITFLNYLTIDSFGNRYFQEYLSPFVIIASLALYRFFHQVSIPKKFFSRISYLTLGIYLIHAGVLDIVLYLLSEVSSSFLTHAAPGTLIVSGIVLLVSLVATYIMSKVKWLRKIV